MHVKLYALFMCVFFVGFTAVVSAQVTEKTQRQIELLLKEKQSRTPAQRKMDSRFLQAVRESRGKKMIDSVDLEPAKVNADAAGNLNVDINADISDAFLKKLELQGATIIFSSAQYHTVRARVNFSKVEEIAGYPEVTFIQPAVESITIGSGARARTESADKAVVSTNVAVKKNDSKKGQNLFEQNSRHI